MALSINSYEEFASAVLDCGFTMGGENSEGIYSLCGQFGKDVAWHTGQPDTDPWEWRMRVLNEKRGIAYGKFFFRKAGYISREWLPAFISARRYGLTWQEDYEAGNLSQAAKDVCQILSEGELPVNEIKSRLGITKEDNARFERAVVESQMKLHICPSGNRRKTAQNGEEYGWAANTFRITEDLFGPKLIRESMDIPPRTAFMTIKKRVLELNPGAPDRKIERFVLG